MLDLVINLSFSGDPYKRAFFYCIVGIAIGVALSLLINVITRVTKYKINNSMQVIIIAVSTYHFCSHINDWLQVKHSEKVELQILKGLAENMNNDLPKSLDHITTLSYVEANNSNVITYHHNFTVTIKQLQQIEGFTIPKYNEEVKQAVTDHACLSYSDNIIDWKYEYYDADDVFMTSFMINDYVCGKLNKELQSEY